jgi:hypothetical protein
MVAAGRCRLLCPWPWLNFGGAARDIDRREERQKRRATDEESDRGRLDLRAETCSAHRDSDVFLGKEDERKIRE